MDNTPVALQKVSGHTLAAIDKRLASNPAAILLEDYCVVVDAGMRPDTARLFRSALEETSHLPVRFLCVTHYHADHVFGLAPFKDVTLFGSARVMENMKRSPDWSSEALAKWKTNDPGAGEWLDQVEFILPTLLFEKRLDICNGGKTVEFHHSGGHTNCSVYGYFPEEAVLFAGDLLFAGKFPYAADDTCDPEAWIATLKTWLGMDILHVIPGHGPVTDLGEVRTALAFFESLKENTLLAIKQDRGYHEIQIPAVYPVGEKESGLMEKTRKRWFEYYAQGAGGIQI